jgi:hypothetical protein
MRIFWEAGSCSSAQNIHYLSSKFHCNFHNSFSLDNILLQLNPVQIFTHFDPNICLNILFLFLVLYIILRIIYVLSVMAIVLVMIIVLLVASNLFAGNLSNFPHVRYFKEEHRHSSLKKHDPATNQ